MFVEQFAHPFGRAQHFLHLAEDIGEGRHRAADERGVKNEAGQFAEG